MKRSRARVQHYEERAVESLLPLDTGLLVASSMTPSRVFFLWILVFWSHHQWHHREPPSFGSFGYCSRSRLEPLAPLWHRGRPLALCSRLSRLSLCSRLSSHSHSLTLSLSHFLTFSCLLSLCALSPLTLSLSHSLTLSSLFTTRRGRARDAARGRRTIQAVRALARAVSPRAPRRLHASPRITTHHHPARGLTSSSMTSPYVTTHHHASPRITTRHAASPRAP